MLGYFHFCYQFYRAYLAVVTFTLACTIMALLPDSLTAKYVLALPACWFWGYAMFSSRRVLGKRKEMLSEATVRPLARRTRFVLGLAALLFVALAVLVGAAHMAWAAVMLWYFALVPGAYLIWHEYRNCTPIIDSY
jgi:hypothetical protein